MSGEDYKATFAKNLNRLMYENGKTQTDMVRELGVKKSAVSNWCLGISMPRMDKVKALAIYFGVEVVDLLKEYNPKEDFVDKVSYRVYHDDSFYELVNIIYNSSDRQLKRLMKLYEAMTEDNE